MDDAEADAQVTAALVNTDPSLASTLRAVVEARKAAARKWSADNCPERGDFPRWYADKAKAYAALEAREAAWFESHGEAAAAALERLPELEASLASEDTHFHRWCRETGSSAVICLTCGSVDDGDGIRPAGSLRDFLGEHAENCSCGPWSHETADRARTALEGRSS